MKRDILDCIALKLTAHGSPISSGQARLVAALTQFKPLLTLLLFLPMILQGQEVKHTGAMRQVMTGASLANTLRWDTIQADYLFGLGPLGRLEGEVTVWNNQIFVAKVDPQGSLITTTAASAESPFGVYADASEFLTVRMEGPVHNIEVLDKAIAALAREARWNMEEPFLFRVEGEFSRVKLHVLAKPAQEMEHNHELHEKAKRYFHYQDISGELVGFYSEKHAGVFTHRGHFTHIHFIDASKEIMGHLDDIAFNGEVVVYFPVKR